jgi:hypothetical protein
LSARWNPPSPAKKSTNLILPSYISSDLPRCFLPCQRISTPFLARCGVGPARYPVKAVAQPPSNPGNITEFYLFHGLVQELLSRMRKRRALHYGSGHNSRLPVPKTAPRCLFGISLPAQIWERSTKNWWSAEEKSSQFANPRGTTRCQVGTRQLAFLSICSNRRTSRRKSNWHRCQP